MILIVIALMRKGWINRQKEQSHLGTLPEVPASYDNREPLKAIPGIYVSTNVLGDWLDRITVESLGVKSASQLFIFDDGIIFERDGAKDIYIPATEIYSVRTESGASGKFVEKDGLLVISWVFGEQKVDTAFRTQFSEDKTITQDLLLRISPQALTSLSST